MDTDKKLPIDKLPEEMLVEIFSLLDSKDLHELAKVRSEWKQWINNNAKTRKKLTLVYYRSIYSGSQGLQIDDFRYHKISVDGRDFPETMSMFSNDLRHLELKYCSLSQILADALSSLRNLEVLEVRDVQSDYTFDEIQVPKLENLKTVVTNSWQFLKFIELSQLTSFEFTNSHPLFSRELEYFIEFLYAQTKLEEIKLSDIENWYANIKPEDIEKMNFPLKRLTLHHLTNFMGGEENALAFLERFSNTLEELKLPGHFGTSVWALVFKNMQKLQSLELSAFGLPQDENFYKTLPDLSSVKKLVICLSDDGNQQGFQGVIEHLPNVETLVMRGWMIGNELMTFVSNNLLKLKSLKIDGDSENAFRGVKAFENLRKFDVKGIDEASDEEWSEMLAAMPNVEQFTVQIDDGLDSAMFDILTKSLKKLRVLNMGYGDFVLEAQMFKNLLDLCPNIKTVRVSGCEADDPAFKDFKKPGLRLIARNYMKFVCLEDEKDPTSLNY